MTSDQDWQEVSVVMTRVGAGFTSRSFGQMTVTSLPKGAKRPRLRTKYFMSWSYQATMIFLGMAFVQSGSAAFGGALKAWLPAALSSCFSMGRPSASGSKNPAHFNEPHEIWLNSLVILLALQTLGRGQMPTYSCLLRQQHRLALLGSRCSYLFDKMIK